VHVETPKTSDGKCKEDVMARVAMCVAVVGVCIGGLLVPIDANAQGSIVGQVQDSSGAVLPGVTVEVSSPALIEKVRTAVTDGSGRYAIVDLRPGIYAVTFSLAGFRTVVRVGINLPAGFTASVNMQLAVGELKETVTVTGAPPVVDVHQATRTQVLSREVLDSIVNTGTPWTIAQLAPGVAMAGPDVGGSRYVNDLQLEARGAIAKHTTIMQEGMSLNLLAIEGAPVLYNQNLATQEVAIQADGGGGSAEVMTGGVVLNLVPKDGGNKFTGQAYLGKTNGSWMADNFTQKLKDLGVQSVGKLDKIFDYAGSVGGPIVRDRLWFHDSFRFWGAWTPIPGRLYNDGSTFINEEDIISNVIRLTAQPTKRNKLSVFLDRQDKRRGPVVPVQYPAIILPGQVGADPETAIDIQNKGQGWKHAPYWQAQAKWTSPVSNRLLLEAGYTSLAALVAFNPMPGAGFDRGTPEWFQYVRKNDLDTGVQWDSVEEFTWYLGPAARYMASVSYVTGTHNSKTGFTTARGTEEQHRHAYGDISEIQYRSGVPSAVGIRNYPWIRKNRVDYETGWFAQDSWTIDRLSISGGIRADWMTASVPEQHVPAGRFVGARNFEATEGVPKWGPDWSPRFGLAYDLFGNAKTAIKFSVGKYLTRSATALANRSNPMALVTQFLPWDDRDLQGRVLPTNGDNILQDNELDLRRLPTNFGERRLDRFDPDLQREYNVETTVSVERELMQNVSLSVGWYRRSFYNVLFTDVAGDYEAMVTHNLARTFDDYRPIQVVSPYNGEVFTVYDLKSASKLALVDNFVTNAPDHRRVYNGFEFALNSRLPRGGQVITSLTTQRSITKECDVRDDPNKLRFCDRFNLPSPYNPVDFKNEFKVGAYVPLRWGTQASVVFTSVVGRTDDDIQRVDELLPLNWLIDRNTRYTAADCAGRPCTPGQLVIPGMVQTSLVVPLAPNGTERHLPRLNMLNLSFQKILRAGGVEWRPQADIYNATNTDAYYGEISANFGTPKFGVPSRVVLGRMLRLSVQLKW
jgi:hypothetical protein